MKRRQKRARPSSDDNNIGINSGRDGGGAREQHLDNILRRLAQDGQLFSILFKITCLAFVPRDLVLMVSEYALPAIKLARALNTSAATRPAAFPFYLQEMEENKSIEATLQLAQFYLWGLNTVQVDRTKAEVLLRTCIAPTAGNSRSSSSSGGGGGDKEEQKKSEARSLLADILENFGGSTDEKEVKSLYQNAKDCCFTKSDDIIDAVVGVSGSNGPPPCSSEKEKKREAAISEITRRARLGDPRSQAHLGELCQSARWTRAAAKQGHAGAQWTASRQLHDLLGDTSESRRWLLAGVAQGDPNCLNSLGMQYEHGELGFPRDPGRAVTYYEASARKGDLFGQYYLGRCFLEGVGVPVDTAKGKEWLKLASSRGLSQATNSLSLFFDHF